MKNCPDCGVSVINEHDADSVKCYNCGVVFDWNHDYEAEPDP